MLNINKGFLVFLLFCSVFTTSARDPLPLFPVDPLLHKDPSCYLFGSHDILELELTTNLRTFVFDIGDDRSSHPGVLKYIADNGMERSLNVRLRARGNFRRDRIICDFPPVRIQFDTSQTSGSLFEGQYRLKLVTHCRNASRAFEQFIIQEYLIYRIYNLLTGYSFRVRPALITYRDAEGKMPDITRFSFFIENANEMAGRNSGKIIEFKGLAQYKTDYEKINIFTVFHYFIGNTDWSVPDLHNVELLFPSEGGPVIAIPYDFDFSGVINAPYAIPDPKLPISSVRKRLFRSFCRTREELQPTFDLFIRLKDDIYSLYNDMPLLTDGSRRRALKYYDMFYNVLQSEKKIEREFISTCRGAASGEDD